MDSNEIFDYARKLLEAHGSRAEAEAAQNASKLDTEGKYEEAGTWRRIREAIHEMRPPHES